MFIPSFNKLCVLVGTHGYLFCVLFYNLNLNYLFCCSNGSSFGLHKFFHLTLYPVDIPHPFAYWAYNFRFPPHILILQDQFSSVAQSCLTLCEPMNRSTQGPPVHHQLPEFIQTHVHQVSDTIQPPHLLLSPLLLPPIPPSIRIFFNESTLHMRWPKYWNFSFSIIPSKEIQDWSLESTGWISLQSKGLSRVFSNTTVQKHQFFCAQLSSQSNSHIHTWPQEKP